MKKLLMLVLAAAMVFSLCACGGQAEKTVDLKSVYDSALAKMPEMMVLDGDARLNFLGVEQEDCAQVYTAIAADGMLTDEIWVIEARDDQAFEKISQLADARMAAKAEETQSYSPEQYAVVQKGEILRSGRYLVLLVTPEAAALKAEAEAALK